MKIENHFQQAQMFLASASLSFYDHKYTQALLSLTKAYPHVRSLIELIYKLDRTASAPKLSELQDTETPLECLTEQNRSSGRPAGENTGGPESGPPAGERSQDDNNIT